MIRAIYFRRAVRSEAKARLGAGQMYKEDYDRIMRLTIFDVKRGMDSLPKGSVPDIIAAIAKYVQENWIDILKVLLALAAFLDSDE